MKNIPEIRFIFSYLLYYGESRVIYEAKNIAQKYPTIEACNKKTKLYEKAWRDKENTIIAGLYDLFNIEFYKPIIDISVAPYFIPKSEPLTINLYREPNEAIDIVSHELIHMLFTDNKVLNKGNSKGVDLLKEWEQLFGKNHSQVTLVHIPIHAALKALYLDILCEPERLERDIQRCEDSLSYKAAWDYVQTNDYKKINAQVAGIYKA